MSRKYKFKEVYKPYFISFATVNWIDIFTRRLYKDILVENINYCIEKKGLFVYAWVVMSNHVHMIIRSEDEKLENILRDLKGYSSKQLLKAIKENNRESRKEWILWHFERAGTNNGNNKKYQFWQQHNQPLVIQNINAMEDRLNYIHNNPVKAGFVDDAVKQCC